jgi:hypothetical protein
VDGVWRSDGYGTVFAIHDGVARTYETTAISCIPGVTYRAATGSSRFDDGDGDVVTIRRAGNDVARLHPDGSVGDWTLRRSKALPHSCRETPSNSPQRTFDVFWRTFKENYPFFRAKHMDWNAMRARYRPTVTKANLYSTLCRMITPLHDNHIALMKDDNPCFSIRPGTTEPGPDLEAKVVRFVERRDLHGAMHTWGNGRIGYRDLPGHLGYLRISGFQNYTAAHSYPADTAEMRKVLDWIFTTQRTEQLKGLIFDMRVNGGGNDALGVQIAARLTNRPYLAYAKRAQESPGRFTTPQPIYVRPANAPRYTGPIAVLTGGSDVSAGETFVQALMGRPRTIRIGDNTQGVFSDILDRTLPNGWAFGLPNEEFRNRFGRTYDGTGIPPEIRTPVFTKAEFSHNRDSAFDTATAILGG